MRLTQGQKDLCLRTVEVAFASLRRASSEPIGDDKLRLYQSALEITRLTLESYPTDRSCYTCDYYRLGHCANNEHALIPLPFRGGGCDAWKDDDVPF